MKIIILTKIISVICIYYIYSTLTKERVDY